MPNPGAFPSPMPLPPRWDGGQVETPYWFPLPPPAEPPRADCLTTTEESLGGMTGLLTQGDRPWPRTCGCTQQGCGVTSDVDGDL